MFSNLTSRQVNLTVHLTAILVLLALAGLFGGLALALGATSLKISPAVLIGVTVAAARAADRRTARNSRK